MAPTSASLRSKICSAANALHISSRATLSASFKAGAALLAMACASFLALPARGQANPTANTFSTYAGGYTGTYAVGGVCGGASSGSKFTALDTFGNGCPLTQAILGPSLSGIGVDAAGNVFLEDYSNGQVRKIDAKSGIVTRLIATANTNCGTTAGPTGQLQDVYGSGCTYSAAKGYATPRGMNVDVWGNVIIGGYNSYEVTVICLATSPLCPGTANRKQIGSIYRVAGCVSTQGATPTAESTTTAITAYTGGDNSLASPFQNLAGDVAAWGLTGTAAAAATVGATNTCNSTSSGSVNGARNAQGDKYGNVYIADTSGNRYRVVLGPATYNGVTNPLFAVINMNPKYTANEGFIYTILGGFSQFTMNGATYYIPSTVGGSCASNTSAVATDTLGDGCAFFETGKPTAAASPAGLGVDRDGNPIFSDTQDSAVRVMYVGGSNMSTIIVANNPGVTPTVGTVYAIEGTGSTSKSATPVLNLSSGNLSSGNTKVAVDGQGNIYLSDGSGFSIIDVNTGYLRRAIANGGTACSTNANGNGDGCGQGQGQSWTSLSSVGTAVTVDNLGNILFADSTGRVRKILAGTLYPTPVGTTFPQTLVFHEPAGTTGISAALLGNSTGITLSGTPTCTLYTTGSDNTADCKISVLFAPTVPGKVGATLAITNSFSGVVTNYPLVGIATDAALVTDTAAPVLASSGTSASQPALITNDTAGNFYFFDNSSHNIYQMNAALSASVNVGTVSSTATQLAVDITGNVYAVSSSTPSITKLTLGSAGTYTSSTFTVNGIPRPQGIVFDTQNNMYLSDGGTQAVYQVPNAAGYASLQANIPVATGLSNPTLLAFDGAGNLLIADTGIVYRVNAETGALTTLASSSSSTGITISGLTPVGLAADSGNNVYIQDSGNRAVYEIPYQTFAPGYVNVYNGGSQPSGLTLDGKGNVYLSDTSVTTIAKITRAASTYTFPTATSTYSGIFTNTGNITSTGYSQTDASEFPYTGTGTGGCGSISGTSALLTGAACTFTVTPNLGAAGALVTNTTTLLPATSIGMLSLTAQEPQGTTYTTTTSISGASTAVYKASGTEITFTVSEAASNSTTQSGTVQVSIDSGAATNYTLTSGSATVALTGLIVGSHTILATYPGNGTYLSSTSATTNFTITQASTSITWTPSATTQLYSAAVGTGVLDATATAPGAFIYYATTGGVVQPINSASYLPLGTYSLSVTFVPTDAVDYAQSSAAVASYSVTKASTTAPLGATQFLVASDGTGNYTSVQSAVNALTTGGSIYIKPGTYTGDITVVQPSVALRGLGGDPTKVILTHAGGAFGGSGVYAYAGEFQVNTQNGYQLPSGSSQFTGDEGSATLVVAKGINTAISTSTTTPNGFYGENFSLINTYDSDTTTTTTTYLPGANSGTCTANEGPAQTYNYLFNNSLLCASQALAIWITSDLAVMNNVYTTSLQDTIYAASQGSGSSGYVPSREYWFRGKVTGDVDYIFGDAAAVFDSTSIYSAWHGASATGTDTIHAQNKAVQTGSSGDYLSGYIMNNDVFTSQSTGMTALYFGRPYGTYSTWIMLNDYIDQVNATGYTTGLGPALGPTTFTEFNDIAYTDPATNAVDLNGIPYLGTGGNTGSGVAGPRENSSTNPGTAMANDNPPTAMTRAQAQAYFPTNFLSQTVPSAVSTTQNWIPTTAIATSVNAFVPAGTSSTITTNNGTASNLTLLMRPQTPGIGAIISTTSGAATTFTVPTGTYTLTDSLNGGASYTLASGTLDASGEAYFNSSTLSVGTHSLTWTYGGDANFAGSTSSSPYTLTINNGGSITTTSVAISGNTTPITYGQSATIITTVTNTTTPSNNPTGSVTLFVDGASYQTLTLASGSASFTVTNLLAGAHTLSASYAGNSTFAAASTTTNYSETVNKAPLTITATCANRIFGQVNSCTATAGSFQYADTAATVIASGPTGTTTALRTSPAATGYVATSLVTFTTFGSANYTINAVNNTFNINGNAAQTITFPALPNFPHTGSYQLVGRSSSGLALTYSITTGGGIASISGAVITVTGAGPVTVQAAQAGNINYGAATSVSQSFTAQ